MFDQADMADVAIVGGGPAGLTCAYEVQKRDPERRILVVEADRIVGGIARTESYKGFRFDIGGHRFFTKVGEVEEMWHEVMGDEFIRVPRLSRIYYRGKFYDYPLKIFNALGNIGPYEASRIMLSYLKWRVRPSKTEESFEQWVINRFGGRLYMHFFRSYTQKVWGIPPRDIQADWAAQRIKNLSLTKAVWNAISGANDTTSLIEEFDYPRLGPGQMWERVTESVEAKGGEVRMRTRATKLHRRGQRIVGLEVEGPDGPARIEARDYVNSMGLRELVHAVDPPPPAEVVDAANRLRYRDFLIVTLVLDRPDPFPDNWIYVHSSDVSVGRIQNFRAWSKDMVPNENQASIGMEYFCQEGDGLWEMTTEDLVAKAAGELERLGLAKASEVSDGTVIRQPKAYPVYDTEYRAAVDVISNWLKGMENLQSVGRNGLHRYNNQDHSMLTAILAARNITLAEGETPHDLWSVNVERSYHEEFQRGRTTQAPPAVAA
jgi:protoporphyrinogen oxidase